MAEKGKPLFEESDKGYKKRRMKWIPMSIIIFFICLFFTILIITSPNPIEAGLGLIGFPAMTILIFVLASILIYRSSKLRKLIIYENGLINPIKDGKFISFDEILKVRYFTPNNYFKFYLKDYQAESIRIEYFEQTDSQKLLSILQNKNMKLDIRNKLYNENIVDHDG